MKLSRSLVKGSMLLSSMLLLSACANPATEETTQEEVETTEAVVEETTVAEETEAETTEAETEEETEKSEEETESETEKETEETEKSEEETEKSEEESESETEKETEEETEKSEEESESETEKETEEETEKSEEESVSETEEETEEETEKSEEESESETEEETEVAALPMAGDAELQDGEYKAVSNEDEHGWSVEHTIVVKDGKVTESNFDYLNAEGKLKSEDEEYNTKMKEIAGVSGAEAMEQLNKALVDKQASDVDVVSGATSTSNQFILSSAALLNAAKTGNTEDINIDELPLNDGEFSLKGEVDEHGWAPEMTMIVKDGKIESVSFDYLDEDGNKKSEDEEYNTKMKEKSGVAGADAMKQLSEALVENQGLEGVDVVSGATSTSETFMSMAKQLIQMSQMAFPTEEVEESSEETEASSEETEKSEETEAETVEENSEDTTETSAS